MRKKSYSVYHNDRESWINITIPNVIGEKLFDAVQEQLAEIGKEQEYGRVKERLYFKDWLYKEATIVVVLLTFIIVIVKSEDVVVSQFVQKYWKLLSGKKWKTY